MGNVEIIFADFRSGTHEKRFEIVDGFEEALDILLAAKTHDAFHASAIVPGTIEDHELAPGRQMRHEALEIPLRILAIRRFAGREDTRFARAHVLGEPLDGAILAGAVAPFDDNEYAPALRDQPALQFDELDLQRAQIVFVFAAVFLAQTPILSKRTGGDRLPARHGLLASAYPLPTASR